MRVNSIRWKNTNKVFEFAVIAAVGFTALLLTGCLLNNEDNYTHTHIWGEIQVTPATCISKGEQKRVCTLDSTHIESWEIPIDPNEHNFDDPVITEATCEEDGKEEAICKLCEKPTVKILTKLGHDYDNWEHTLVPTCTTAGEETRICKRDDTHIDKRSISININAHEWGEWTQTTAPTCTAAGIKTRACMRNSLHIDTEKQTGDPALGHNYDNWTQTTAPTCTTAGIETGTCTRNSSHTTTRAGIPALGHNWGEWVQTTAPTCTAEGIKTRACTRNSSHIDTEKQTGDPALGHDYNWVQTGAPTCDNWGYETGICTRNSSHKEVRVGASPLGHDWGEWTQTEAPSFIKPGTDKRICRRLTSHTETREGAPQLPVTTTADWTSLRGQLWGKTGNYTVTINGDIGVSSFTQPTFGTTSSGSLKVTLKGNGKLYMNGQSPLLYVSENQTLIIDSENLTFQGRKKGQNGSTSDNYYPVVFVYYGTFELKNGNICDNTCLPVSGTGLGGGVYAVSGTFIMSGGKISGNKAYAQTSGYLAYGGGVYLDGGTFTMNGGKISDNIAVSDYSSLNAYGGGVYMKNRATFTMNGGEISNNKASSEVKGTISYGGGVLMEGSGTIFTMNDGKISGNEAYNKDSQSDAYAQKASSGGGGVFVLGGTFNMYNGEISGNKAVAVGASAWASGGGICTSSTFNMYNGKIFNNETISQPTYQYATYPARGGGVYVGSYFNMYNGEIYNNKATGNLLFTSLGGGVFVAGAGNFRIVSGTIYSSNSADTGSVIYKSEGSGVAQYGTSSTSWNDLPLILISNSSHSYTNNAIKVVNGELP